MRASLVLGMVCLGTLLVAPHAAAMEPLGVDVGWGCDKKKDPKCEDCTSDLFGFLAKKEWLMRCYNYTSPIPPPVFHHAG